jgi:hypothetical protein
MKHRSSLRLLTVTAATVMLMGTLMYSLGHASQDAERSLDIERYPDEPLELVDLHIAQKSVKNGIRFKSRDNVSKWGLDNVKFTEKESWLRNVKVRLRNISGKPIYGVSASLYFKHSGLRRIFGAPLIQTLARDLKRQPLQPGEEIELEVNIESFEAAVMNMRKYGLDPYDVPVSLSVDSALFGEDLQWSRGALLRRDPNNPAKWNAVDRTAPPGASRLNQPAGSLLLTSRAFLGNVFSIKHW